MISGVFVGLSTIDIVYGVDQFPRPNAKITAASQSVFVGGPATNAAIAFRHLGGDAALVTGVGRHAVAHFIREELQQHSVSLIDLSPDYDGPPPLSSVWVNAAGDRNVVSPNATRIATSVVPPDEALLEQASIVLVDGHFAQSCQSWARAARGLGKSVVLDGGSWKPGTAELLPCIDTAICSAEFLPPGCSSHEDVLRFLRDHRVGRIAVTRGEQPILVMEHGQATTVPVPAVAAVDTMGAGDILHGAFCCCAAAGCSFVDSLERAARIASESCRYPGTREWMNHVSPRQCRP